MPSVSDIIQALQMEFFYTAQAINGSDDPAFTITYRFETSVPEDDITGRTGWSSWSAAEESAVLSALAHIETFLNVDFVAADPGEDADLSLGLVTQPEGVAGYGGAELWTWEDGSFYSYDGFATFDKTLDLTENFNLILHELGHALGLEHTFDGVALDAAYDSNHYSVMSYTADPESGENNDAMMIYDLLALQNIWGAAAYNTGDDSYTGPRTGNVDTIWDTGGIDTFDASARDTAVLLDLREGTFSTFGSYEDVAIAFGVTIENALGGSGDDALIGNAADNLLVGNDGNDLIRGRAGADTLKGGKGRDALMGGSDSDLLRGGLGRDMLEGGDGDDVLEGGRGIDKLWGDGSADTFCFTVGADTDVVRDFEPGVDAIAVIGLGTRAQVLAAASETGGDVVFDFGDGDLLVVRNTTLDALDGDLSVA
ncbi:MAG: M10 family metallopeptidase C-terminal domain-containing protein [Paracoccaceae bacterium]